MEASSTSSFVCICVRVYVCLYLWWVRSIQPPDSMNTLIIRLGESVFSSHQRRRPLLGRYRNSPGKRCPIKNTHQRKFNNFHMTAHPAVSHSLSLSLSARGSIYFFHTAPPSTCGKGKQEEAGCLSVIHAPTSTKLDIGYSESRVHLAAHPHTWLKG